MKALFERDGRVSFDEMRELVRAGYGKSVASIRVSPGIASNFPDVFRFVEFVRGFLDRSSAEVGAEECGDCRVIREVT